MAQVGLAPHMAAGVRAAGILVSSSLTPHSQNFGFTRNGLSDPLCGAPSFGGGFARPIPKHSATLWEQSLWVGQGFLSPVRASRDPEGFGREEGEAGPGGSNEGLDATEKWVTGSAASEAQTRLKEGSLDKIEEAAKASIDKLRHMIYNLRTQAPAQSSTISSSSEDLRASGSASATKEEDVFIKQDFEVALGSFGDDSSGEDGSDSPEAGAFVHHDALTCTQTAVRIDEKTGTAVVTVTATVRGAEIADQGSYTEHSVALAARALARTCLALDEKAQAALSGGQSVLKTLPDLQSRPHELLTEVLQDGAVVRFSPLVEAGGSPFRQNYEVELEIADWSKASAVFKPFVPGDAHLRWRRAPSEWVAYQVNLLLGLDVVPPAAIRTDVQLGAEKHDLGVMVWAVEGLRPLPSLPTREWGVPSPLSLVSSAHVLDALLGGSPRKPHQFKAGKHWKLEGGLKPVLWEHPMGPGRGALHSMWSHRGELKGVKSIPAMTMARLKALSQNVLFEQLSGALTSDEMELMLERRDQIVAYFEAMAKRHGKEVVLV